MSSTTIVARPAFTVKFIRVRTGTDYYAVLNAAGKVVERYHLLDTHFDTRRAMWRLALADAEVRNAAATQKAVA